VQSTAGNGAQSLAVDQALSRLLVCTIPHRAHMLVKIVNRTRPVVVPPHIGQKGPARNI
jgi:hypothetical protein